MNHHSIAGHHTFRHGSLVLGCEVKVGEAVRPRGSLAHLGGARYQFGVSPMTLSPLFDLMDMTTEEALKSRKQILF